MTVAALPRVLVVTPNNFNAVSGGGITLSNLFRGWPSDRLANLHDDARPEDASVCRTFYRLSAAEAEWAWPFSLARRWRAARAPARASAATDEGMATNGGQGSTRGARLVHTIVGGEIPATPRLPGPLVGWLEAFRPELVYTFLGSLGQIRLAREVARRTGAPLAVHMMDDWPAVIYRRGWLAPLLRSMTLAELSRTLAEARVRLAICPEMADEYRQRYGLQFQAFANVLDLERWRPHARRQWAPGNPIVVRYVGSIMANAQRDSLDEIGAAVAALRRAGLAIELWVHAPADQAPLLDPGHRASGAVRVVEPPEDREVPALLAGADLLVLPFNFDAASARFVRLSMPTKVPAYLASGTPVLVYAPAAAALARYAAREAWGLVVDTPGVPALQAAITRLVSDEALRAALGRRALAVADASHDAARVRPRFQAALTAAVGAGPSPLLSSEPRA